ncbi:MAG: DUF167 domain-containing protein, partial [Methanomassiliicoccales archaeon]|nr:DUF167 domain-containing protein [Methanomassiliicoccales archaeon]
LMVSPSSPRSEVVGVDHWRWRLVVRLRSPPEKGEANQELVTLLGRLFSAPVEVLRGHSSRMKTVSVRTTKEGALQALESLPSHGGVSAGGRPSR